MLPMPFVLERHYAQHEFTAQSMLSSSDCDALSMRDVLDHMHPEDRLRWDELQLGYTQSAGLPALRAEIAAQYQSIHQGHVLTVVPEEGILLALSSLVTPQQPVIVTAPAYQSLVAVVEHCQGNVMPWHPRVREEHPQPVHFDLDDLQRLLDACGDQAPLLVLNFPHNPTGALPSHAEWSQLFAMVKAAGGRVFSDEMYRGLELTSSSLPSACDMDASSVVLCGLSKSMSAPGLRCGWVVTRDDALLANIAMRKDWTTICAPAPAEVLATSVLRRRAELQQRNRAVIASNLQAASRVLAEHDRFRLLTPAAGSVCLLRLTREQDAQAFCDDVLARTGSMLVAASMFAKTPAALRGCVRLGLGRAAFAADMPRTWQVIAAA
jgi:aspartate/methionine/tyrosine aminotransferase